MEEIIYNKSYQEYKTELDRQLKESAEGFVKIGYLLKVARDTNVLHESPYENVFDFAKAEYGIDKSQASRFIHINDKFSEGGYSDRLQEKYQGFGWTKLALMLQLPDALNEELSPSYSKSEIQALKEEMDEEAKVSDIERILEEENPAGAGTASLLDKAVAQLGEDEPGLYTDIFQIAGDIDLLEHPEKIWEIMVPGEEKIYSIRIRGTGRVMLIMSDTGECAKVINSRTGEKFTHERKCMAQSWLRLFDLTVPTGESWEAVYGRKYPLKTEIAPAQPEKPKKETKVVKAKPENPPGLESSGEGAVSEEPQIPGQDNIMNHPEYLPEEAAGESKEAAGGGKDAAGVAGENLSALESSREDTILEKKTAASEPVPEELPNGGHQTIGFTPAQTKTEEQKYAAAQRAIDRKTKEKLREMEDTEKMSHLPSDEPQRVHQIREGVTSLQELLSGERTFEIRKNDTDYRVGDMLEIMGFREGKYTGQSVSAEITFILDEHTALDDDYCILAIRIREAANER